MTREGGLQPISDAELSFRNKARTVLTPVFRGEVVPETLAALDALADHRNTTGKGAIVFANHIDKVDPLIAMLQIVNSHEGLLNAEIVTPLAEHQRMDAIHLVDVSRKAAVHAKTIVTQNSRDKWESRIHRGNLLRKIGPVFTPPGYEELLIAELPKLNTGGREFAKKASDSVATGGLVYLPTQAERSALLRLPSESLKEAPQKKRKERPLGLLVTSLRHDKIPLDEVGLLCLGFSFEGNPDYAKKRGFNFGKKHIVKVGEFMTVAQAVKESGGIENLDEWAIVHGIAPLVDRNYLSPMVKRKFEASHVEKIANGNTPRE